LVGFFQIHKILKVQNNYFKQKWTCWNGVGSKQTFTFFLNVQNSPYCIFHLKT
jgi:hypothetical protein